MKPCQVTIGVNGNQIGVQFIGDESSLLSLIGAVDYTRAQLVQRLQQRTGNMNWGQVDGVQNTDALAKEKNSEYSSEQKVTRNQAIEATLYAIEALQLRVEKMRTSPEEATFQIDTSLLSKL